MVSDNKIHELVYMKCLQEIKDADLAARAGILGAEASSSKLIIKFFGEPFVVAGDGVKDPDGSSVNMAVSLVICRYVSMAPEVSPGDGDWVTYREFRGSGPLVGFFNDNTNKNIESAFSGNIHGLEMACKSLNGVPVSGNRAFDVSMQIPALPRIPILIRFNDRDDDFPAQASVLFRQSAERYLDLDSLTILGTFLTGKLLNT